jgi:hypothetical protein
MKYTRELSIVYIALLVIVTNCYSQANEDISIPEYLSIEESLLPIFHDPYYLSSGKFPFNRINPDIKEYLHFYLEKDNSVDRFSMNAISLLGYIGNNDDIQFVDGYLQEYLASSYRQSLLYKGNIAVGAGCFSGMMIKRKIEGAEAFFKKYAQVSAWYPPDVNDPAITSNASYAYSVFVMMAYEFSHEGYVLQSLQTKSTTGVPYRHELPFSMKESATGSTRSYESVVEMLMTRKTDLYTQSMEPVKISEDKLNEDLNKSLKEKNSVIEALVNKQTYADWQKAQEERKKSEAAKSEKKPTESFENIDLTNTVDGENIKNIAIQAVKAYQRLSLTGNQKSILIKDEFLQALKKAGLKNFDDFKVKVEFETKIGNIMHSANVNKSNSQTTSEPKIVIDKIKTNITFGIQGTAGMLEKFAPDTVHKSLLTNKTGDFKVVMIRINDIWTWAPVVDSPVSADSNIVDDKYLIGSVNKAVIAFNQISQSIIEGNYDTMTIPVLDNDKLIPLEKRKKDKDGMTKALDMEKQILEDLKKNNLNDYGNYQMKVTFDAALDNGTLNLETGTMPMDVKGYETADLTFLIRNGAEAYKTHTTSRNDRSCIDAAGNLKVTMKRINGTWYWNPFGW